jgi:hypothetical protein
MSQISRLPFGKDGSESPGFPFQLPGICFQSGDSGWNVLRKPHSRKTNQGTPLQLREIADSVVVVIERLGQPKY